MNTKSNLRPSAAQLRQHMQRRAKDDLDIETLSVLQRHVPMFGIDLDTRDLCARAREPDGRVAAQGSDFEHGSGIALMRWH